MSTHLFKYANGRREFREIDAKRHIVYRLYDLRQPSTPTPWSIAAFAAMAATLDARLPRAARVA